MGNGFAERYIGLGQQGEQDRRATMQQNALSMYAPKAFAGDRSAVQGLAQAGLVNEAQGFQNQFRAEDAAKAQKELQDAERRASIYFDVKDDAGLAQANQMAMQMGATPEQLPKTPQEAQAQIRMYMGLKNQIEARFKEQEFALKEREFGLRQDESRATTAFKEQEFALKEREFGLRQDESRATTALRRAQIGTEAAQAAKYRAEAANSFDPFRAPLAPQMSAPVQTPSAPQGVGLRPSIMPGQGAPQAPSQPPAMTNWQANAPMNPYDAVSPKDRSRLFMQNQRAYEKVRSDNAVEAAKARETLNDAQVFLGAQQRVENGGGGTGGFFAIPGVGDLAQAAYKVGGPQAQDYALMDSISAKLIPKMREPGSGATSDFDARMFGRGTLGLDKPGPTNEVIGLGMKAAAQNLIDKAQFEDVYFQRFRTMNGSDVAWNAYLSANPIFDPKSPNEPVLNRQRQNWRDYMQSAVAARQESGGGNANAGATGAQATIDAARSAVARGANPQEVARRLQAAGIDPAKAGLAP